MGVFSWLRRFAADGAGAVLPLVVILIPAMLLVGGTATDISQLNAQRRYTQAQADLAAQSAARHLPDPVAVRAAARRVVRANPLYGDLALADSDIRLGSYSYEAGFVPVADQNSPVGVSAVEVSVPSPFRPILLGPVLSEGAVQVRRRAVAGQSGAALFMLRNRLVGLDLEQSALSGLLAGLGLGSTVNLLSYEGLVNTRISIRELLGLVSAGVAAETLNFGQLLDLPVAVPRLLGGLVQLGGLPASAVPDPYPSTETITLNEILKMSPALARVTAGDILPDVSLTAFDFLVALANLQTRPEERLGADVDLDLDPLLPGLSAANKLVGLDVDLGLIRPPVWLLARPGESPPQKAVVEQSGATIRASTLSLLDLTLKTGVARAEAGLISLNCAASRPGDVVAVFEVSTSPITLDARLSLIRLAADMKERDMSPVPLNGRTQLVSITKSQIGTPVKISTPISVTQLSSALRTVLQTVKSDVQDRQKECQGVLGKLLCPVGMIVNGVTSSLTTLLGNVLSTINNLLLQPLLLDSLVAQLQALLGLAVAEAELVLADTACGGDLVN